MELNVCKCSRVAEEPHRPSEPAPAAAAPPMESAATPESGPDGAGNTPNDEKKPE